MKKLFSKLKFWWWWIRACKHDRANYDLMVYGISVTRIDPKELFK